MATELMLLIALLTLARIGVDPKTLVDALRLLEFYNRRNGLAVVYNLHPPIPVRADFARQINTWLETGAGVSIKGMRTTN